MIRNSDGALAALDRRLQVDRVLALAALAPIGRALERPASLPAAFAAGSTRPADTAQPATATIAGRLPLGRVIDARVVDVPRGDHVIAEFETLRIDLAWSAANGATPRPGADISLRVLAHAPRLVFQTVSNDLRAAADVVDDNTHWSSDVMRLLPHGAIADATPAYRGAVRFDVPILQLVATPTDTPVDTATGPVASPHDAERPAAVMPPATARDDALPPAVSESTATMVAGGPGAGDASRGDPTSSPAGASTIDDGRPPATGFVPLVLQGPAWPGQPMELVVRRDRDDAQFDNPVLDHWCGEVTIDLPHLGRVAAHFAFSLQGLRLRVDGDDIDAVDAMSAAAPALAIALTGADLRVSALTIGRPAPDCPRPDDGDPALRMSAGASGSFEHG